MKRLSLALILCLLAAMLSGCKQQVLPSYEGEQIDPVDIQKDFEELEPIIPEPADKTEELPGTEPEDKPEGDIDSDTLEQIGALEQNSSVRDDDIAPLEASSYCKLTVTAEALLARKDDLTDVLLPPDGVFYSGALALAEDTTAAGFISDTLAACGLICEMDGSTLKQVAAIPDDLQEDMHWVVYCNGVVVDDAAAYVLRSGDALVLSYEVK